MGPLTINPSWGELSPGRNLTTQRAEVPSLYYKIQNSRAELCPVVPVPPNWGWGSAAAGFPHSQDTTSFCSSLWIPLNCCYHCAASTEWAKPRNCLLEKPNTAKGRGKKIKKKNKSHTGHSFHYEKSNELLYIHIANNFTSWEMSLLSLLFHWGWRVLVCWVLAWAAQCHTESMLSVVVGVLNKIDGVGASGGILFDLEVLC